MSKSKTISLLILLVAIITCFIFYNSLKNIDESNESSDVVLAIFTPITSFFDSMFGEMNWYFIIRKGAHLTEFCVLGGLVSNLAYKIKEYYDKHFMGYGLFYVLLVAVTDEFIQSFSDRTSSVSDVLIDLTGALTGIIIVTLLSSRKK